MIYNSEILFIRNYIPDSNYMLLWCEYESYDNTDDIGKNIVKVMLENYGYDVIDLGKDVPPEVIVDCAIENNIRVVGLSALMTTTVASMEETIKLMREKKPDTKIVVGGAVMTPEYADQIGADAYAKDAMATVRYCDSVFEGLIR